MPPVVARTCSECGSSLAGMSVRAITCSGACRLRRSRRIRRSNREVREFAEKHNSAAQEISAIVRREAPDVITRVMKTELAPIVREALTEDVLRSINQLVGLTPRAVQALSEDLDSPDTTLRQRAYTLLVKYTIGHPALVKADATEAGGQMVVNFNLPRPEEQPAPVDAEEPVEEELAACDMCGAEKPLSEFVAGSTRCTECFETWRQKIRAEFA